MSQTDSATSSVPDARIEPRLHPALRRAYGIEDLPGLIATAAELAPDRIALRHGDTALTYAALHTEIEVLGAAMGGGLSADVLVSVVVSSQLPELLDSADGALGDVLTALVDDALLAAGPALPTSFAPSETLVTEFAAQVRRTPEAVALEYRGATMTYAELDARSEALAKRLVCLGVGPDDLVGLAVRRSFDLLIGMYAIVKAGGAYVPIDPEHPAERIGYVLEAAAPVLVLTTGADEP
ncbi:AMP-binding protein, partial [Streptomyces roseolus]|uniref:AMP-binding protein n=1 Tax=Streptomyces roseolus TaxID=67358 RepID=UPI003651156F